MRRSNNLIVLAALKTHKLAGKGFPEVLNAIKRPHTYVVFKNTLGPSLLDLLKTMPVRMNEATAYFIGIQLVNRIERLH